MDRTPWSVILLFTFRDCSTISLTPGICLKDLYSKLSPGSETPEKNFSDFSLKDDCFHLKPEMPRLQKPVV